MKLTYHHAKQLAFSLPFAFVIKGFVAMLKEGLAHPCVEFNNVSEVVYAVDEDARIVVGAQVYNIDEYGRVFTHLAYVLPEYRGQGIAVKLFELLEANVRANKPHAKIVFTSAMDDNASIKEVFKKTGRDHFTTKFVKWLKRK